MTERSSAGTVETLHYLTAIRTRMETLYALVPNDPRLREQLSDEVDWIDARIKQAGVPAQQTQWQPIETAPKDEGVHLLLHGNGDNFTRCSFVGYWTTYGGKPRWQMMSSKIQVEPTRWMPLPLFDGPALPSTDSGALSSTGERKP